MRTFYLLLVMIFAVSITNAQPPKKVKVKPNQLQIKSGTGKNKTQVKVNTKSGKIQVK